MKETTYIANKIINDYERLSSNEIKELEELLDLNDQEMMKFSKSAEAVRRMNLALKEN